MASIGGVTFSWKKKKSPPPPGTKKQPKKRSPLRKVVLQEKAPRINKNHNPQATLIKRKAPYQKKDGNAFRGTRLSLARRDTWREWEFNDLNGPPEPIGIVREPGQAIF